MVAVMLLSWLVVTNHCALGRMQGGNAGHAHCHAAKNDDGKKAPEDGMRECCRAIKASLSSHGEFKCDASQLPLQIVATPQLYAAPLVEASGILLDHGPPRAASFAEIVLQRSLLGHAPPTLV
jgi:hypothetical protein